MAETLISPGIALSETDLTTVVAGPVVTGAAIIGPTVKGPVLVPTKVTSYNEYVRTFGTTFLDNGVQQEFMTSVAAKNYFDQGGESILVVRVADPKAFKAAESTIMSGDEPKDGYGSIAKDTAGTKLGFKLHTLGEGAIFNSLTGETVSLKYGGTKDNFKFEVYNVDSDNKTFDLAIRRGDDDPDNKIVLETWTNLSLDPYNSNYIAAVIGDQVTKYDESSNCLKTEGEFTNKSAYIRVEMVSADNVNVPTSKCWGLFSGATGEVGKAYKDGAEQSEDQAKIAYFSKITTDTNYPQSVSPEQYEPAINLLGNSDDYQFNVVIAPGLTYDIDESAKRLTLLVNVCRDRGDAIAVVDPCTCGKAQNSSVVSAVNSVNNSYGAAYWPWLQVYSSAGRLVWVPASVVIPGVYVYNDNLTAPWYAPAGMTRGGIAAVQASQKLAKSDRDELYKGNVNPIATLPGTGLVVYGQKTLQKKATALDRVNVRRLLIEIKKNVKEMASELLFEQNTAALRNNFEAKLDPYLANIVQRNGLYNYAINLDGNTAEAIDRCEFHCKITLQPTKVVEFVYINFTLTATGVEFS